LEEEAGVSARKVCYAHGSLQWATCCVCKRKVSAKEIEGNILSGTVPYCQAPVVAAASPLSSANSATREPSARMAASRKRNRLSAESAGSTRNGECDRRTGQNGERVCGGVMKPGVTFFGEALHNTVKSKLQSDRGKVDALIVIGTSLSV
jgi:NAD-dependent SIR2 family protein deacetylase